MTATKTYNLYFRKQWAVLPLCLVLAPIILAQSSATFQQTVNQRNTLGALSATPTSGLTAGSTVALSYVLHTAGTPAPTSETVQFYDNGSPLGTSQSISSIPGSNLLPYSQVNVANAWMLIGAPTVSSSADTGPDGSSTSATRLVLPSSATQQQGASYAVSGTSYASLSMTVSVWAKASAATTLTLGITDNPAASANQSGTCSLTTVYQRCVLTYVFPSNANAGFIVSFYTSGQSAGTVDLWGTQVEQASVAGPYVSTIGTARPSGGAGGSAVYSYAGLAAGAHSITVVYAGDNNFVGSTSNNLALTVTKSTPSLAVTASAASPQAYGTSLTFTATLTGSAGNPSGTVQLLDGASVIGSGTLVNGAVAFTLSGASALSGGTHNLTVTYPGDTNYSATSSSIAYTISKASNSVTISAASSLNPSTYGDNVTFTATVATGIGGAIPTGSVVVADASTATNIGTFTLDSTGKATFSVPLLTAGNHSITFTYSGDGNYQ